jgi:transcriptional regulator with XRE-family HTH domain
VLPIAIKRRFIVNEIAEKKGYSNVSAFQKVSGVTYPTLHAIWNNTAKSPEYETLRKIAAALGVKIEELFVDEEEPAQVWAVLR